MNTKISVVTRLQDNGDGGYTMFLYNNNQEMLADHPNVKNGYSTNEDVLNEVDPYEDGYLGTATIEVTEDGKIVPFSLHAGQ